MSHNPTLELVNGIQQAVTSVHQQDGSGPVFFLRRLGVYGYDQVEPVVLAALVSEEPLLLIGRHGTGKTFLLNSLSEALGLEHRHYNASMVSFDDLVGFPYPEKDGNGIKFLETPATVWQAESVLVDELNRCKPEHQNRFFALVHERRLQGMLLSRLRYRWAAMNPCGEEYGYSGTEPLDPALADRFAFLVPVVDWEGLNPEDQARVADPRGDGVPSHDGGCLVEFLRQRRQRYLQLLTNPPGAVLSYVKSIGSAFADSRDRISPRRVRQIARNLIATMAVCDLPWERLFKLVLRMSLPHRVAAVPLSEPAIDAAHRLAWDGVALTGRDQWLHEFAGDRSLSSKVNRILRECPDPDTGSMAVAQLIASEDEDRARAFALAITPHLLSVQDPPVGAEGLNDLSRIMTVASEVNAVVRWRDHSRQPLFPEKGQLHEVHVPGYLEAVQQIEAYSSKRKHRVLHFLHCLIASHQRIPEGWTELARQYEDCFRVVMKYRQERGIKNGSATT